MGSDPVTGSQVYTNDKNIPSNSNIHGKREEPEEDSEDGNEPQRKSQKSSQTQSEKFECKECGKTGKYILIHLSKKENIKCKERYKDEIINLEAESDKRRKEKMKEYKRNNPK